jgi:selenocysteine-specific translation elongation factor
MANIAIIGSNNTGKTSLARSLGKKGTESDITLYHFTKKDAVYSLIDVQGYPASLKPLITALNLSDAAILCISLDGIDAATGECIIACDLLQIPQGLIAITKADTAPYKVEEMKKQIQRITKGTKLEHWEVIAVSTTDYTGMDELRDKITQLGTLIQTKHKAKDSKPARVIVDHFFNVTGIGCVVLGVVNQGTLHVKDQLTVYPLERKTEIRSIQINDVNHKSAPSGARVGLALKGVQAKEFERGFIISNKEDIGSSFTLNCEITKYAKGFKIEDVLHLYAGLQSTPVRVEKIIKDGEVESVKGGDTCTCVLSGEKRIAYNSEDTFLLAQLNEPKQRLLARCAPASKIYQPAVGDTAL